MGRGITCENRQYLSSLQKWFSWQFLINRAKQEAFPSPNEDENIKDHQGKCGKDVLKQRVNLEVTLIYLLT